MYKHIHSSFGYLTPAEFEDQWRKEQACEQKNGVIDEQQRV
jgi:transposase InsO family protein